MFLPLTSGRSKATTRVESELTAGREVVKMRVNTNQKNVKIVERCGPHFGVDSGKWTAFCMIVNFFHSDVTTKSDNCLRRSDTATKSFVHVLVKPYNVLRDAVKLQHLFSTVMAQLTPWKSDLPDKIKRDFFHAVAVSILL